MTGTSACFNKMKRVLEPFYEIIFTKWDHFYQIRASFQIICPDKLWRELANLYFGLVLLNAETRRAKQLWRVWPKIMTRQKWQLWRGNYDEIAQLLRATRQYSTRKKLERSYSLLSSMLAIDKLSWISAKVGNFSCSLGTGFLSQRCHHKGLRKDKALKTL
jgi:hypothetical protein